LDCTTTMENKSHQIEIDHVCARKRSLIMPVYMVLIASLPFFSIRPESLGISIPLLLLLSLLFISPIVILTRGKIPKIYGDIDIAILLYLLLSLISGLFSDAEDVSTAIMKSYIYYFCYLALKYYFSYESIDNIKRFTVLGVLLGAVSFLIISIYSIYASGLTTAIFNDLTYWGFTFKVFGSINSVLLSKNEIISADVMRNVIGEVFAFYFIALLFMTSNKINNANRMIMLGVNTVFVLATFSRRAFFSSLTSLAVYVVKKTKVTPLMLVVYAILFLLLMYFIFFGFLSESRLLTVSDDSRISMYGEALASVDENLLFGIGYAKKLNGEKYVHNFVLASTYMLGVLGFLLSMYIYGKIMLGYMNGFWRESNNVLSYALIIPIFGMTVGSTVEGIFTPVGWIVLALYGAGSRGFIGRSMSRLPVRGS